MPNRHLPLGCALLACVVGCSPEKTTVRPVEVNYEMTGQDPVGHVHAVVGKIFYGLPEPGEPAIVSEGAGGACLLVKQNKQCEDASDCTTPPNGYAYCLDTKMVAGHMVGQCWVKGDDLKYCMKSKRDLGHNLEKGTLYDVPLHGNDRPEAVPVIRGPATVRLATCLNPPISEWPTAPDGTKQAPCGLEGIGAAGALPRYGPPVDLP